MHPTDKQIVDALLAKDEKMTNDFFFVWCRPLFYSLIRKVFSYDVDYDELVNELYVYLMDNDGQRLRTFQGRSSIYQWLKCVATRFFLEKRDGQILIDDSTSEPLYQVDKLFFEPTDCNSDREDFKRMLSQMRNSRHRLVLQRLLLDGAEYNEVAEELSTSVPNVYNLKSRAWAEFTAIVLKEYDNG